MKKYKTLKDHVYDYIAEQILEGNLIPSQRINETAISQELSVSRTPVREALIQLSCEDILENVPRKGFVLKGVTEKEAAELYTVIGTLDGTAAQASCDTLTEKDLKRMEFYIQSMDLAINTNNYEMYLEQQELFHQVYIDQCENEILSDTISRLRSKFFTRGYSKDRANKNENCYHRLTMSIVKFYVSSKKKTKMGFLAILSTFIGHQVTLITNYFKMQKTRLGVFTDNHNPAQMDTQKRMLLEGKTHHSASFYSVVFCYRISSSILSSQGSIHCRLQSSAENSVPVPILSRPIHHKSPLAVSSLHGYRRRPPHHRTESQEHWSASESRHMLRKLHVLPLGRLGYR